MTHAELVVDASVVLRGLTSEGASADILEEIVSGAVRANAPELLIAETSNALAVAVRTERLPPTNSQLLLRSVLDSPIELHPTAPLAPAALELAASTELSAYDAFYAVLAQALDVPLVTADRKLAASVPGVQLVD